MTHSSLGRQPMSAQPRPYSIRAIPDAGAGAGSGQRAAGSGSRRDPDGVVFRVFVLRVCFVLFCFFSSRIRE